MTYGVVYRLVCESSGKVYVGQTTSSIDQRFAEHMLITARKGYALGAAIRKHGRSAFRIEALEYCDTREDLDASEIFWIQWYNTLSPAGYNLASGGHGFRHSSETRAKQSEIAKRRFANEAERRKISEAKRASGYQHSDETRARMSEKSKGRPAHNKGEKMSAAQREKLREAWVRRKARAVA